ncbi:MAG: serine/threonine protein kinase, partial [Burkholderiaceae bacterium]
MPRDGLPQAAQVADDLAGCLPRGYRLNEFVIDRVIAEGGFGVVYSALDLRLKRRVAIKEYMPSLLARRAGDFSVQPRSSVRHQDAFAVGLKSFINEARLLAQFDHPSLVRVHQFWEDKGTGFIVMPLYEGPTLKQWLAANPPPDETWLRAFLDRMLDALALLHAADCLHRDVAPDNILVLKDGAPLLLDFGAARRVLDELTQSLTVIVKPGYAPIEQYADVSGLKQGPWTDLYALCATAHAIIRRQPPPPAVARTVHDEMTPLSEAAFGRYSHALLAALDAGLAVRPEHRPPSVEVLRALIAAGDQDDAERTVLLSPAPAATTQDAAAEKARTTPAPIESGTVAAVASVPVQAEPASQARPAGAPTQAASLPAAFKRRSRVFELLFERPLAARDAALAIAAALIGVGAI